MKLALAAHRSPLNAAAVLGLTIGACCLIAYCRLVLGLEVVCTHVAYLPIVLAGAWWGRRGVWVAAGLGACVLVFKMVAPAGETWGADLIRVLLFLTVGMSMATLSDRDARSRRALEAAQDRLQVSEKLASMGQLAAAVAHEINNPLGTILLYSHGLLRDSRCKGRESEDIRMIAGEAARCRDIVRGLLDFARKSRVTLAPANLSQLLEEVRAIMLPKGKPADVEVTVSRCEVPGEWNLDRTQVRQMLVNLVANGIDACKPGGRVSLAAFALEDGRLEITVSDDGCGIGKEDIGKLFTPFFTTKQRGKGTGLGLAIAYGVVKMHRGEIWAESDPAGGTVFRIRLPLLEGCGGTGIADAGEPSVSSTRPEALR